MPKPAVASNKQSKPASNNSGAQAQTASRTKRLVGRRGRARGRAEDSDAEVEREALSDDSADAHVDSDSADSDADGPLARGGRLESPHPLAPPTPESPHRRPSGAPHSKPKQHHTATVKASSSKGGPGPTQDLSAPVAQRDWATPAAAVNAVDALMDWGSTTIDWSAENVPVVDFEDFAAGRAPLSPSDSSPKPTQGRGSYADRRAEDRDTRQAYLESLRTNPAFVPTVGTFWTHDDRLMDKSLRRMNNWNTRRAQRGGFGRGRGALGRPPIPHADESELPPAERSTWVHDGFEELSRNDEPKFSNPSPRGRGNFFPRGRGRGGFFRGGFVQSTTRYINSPTTRSTSSGPAFSQSQRSISTSERRVWFIMKPERSWTKQFDTFLFQDWSLRPRHNVGPGIRIKLPGSNATSVRLPLDAEPSKTTETPARQPLDQSIVVKLKPDPVPSVPADVKPSTSQLKPNPTPYHPPAVRHQTQPSEGSWIWHAPPPPGNEPPVRPVTPPSMNIVSSPPSSYPLERPSMPMAPPPPPPPPVTTSFIPTFHQSTPSPGSYSSPYGYPQPLPYPPNGGHMGYDGRPMYYAHPSHHTPHPSMSLYGPPPPPQPMHVHQASVQFMPQPPMEYYAPPPPPPPPPHQPLAPVIDPETGRPFFTPARSSGRIEIRAPSEGDSGSKPKRPSSSRTSSTPDVPRESTRSHVATMIDNGRGTSLAPQQYAPQGSYYYFYPMPADGYGYGAPVQYGASYDAYPAPHPEHMPMYY